MLVWFNMAIYGKVRTIKSSVPLNLDTCVALLHGQLSKFVTFDWGDGTTHPRTSWVWGCALSPAGHVGVK